MPKRKILVADDDEAVLEYLRLKLGTRFEVVCTSNPGDVVALARGTRPDLILCDVDMPGMDGGDISAALFSDDELRPIPLLFLTGLVSPGDVERRHGQIGGRPAISKTASVEQLVAGIERLLEP